MTYLARMPSTAVMSAREQASSLRHLICCLKQAEAMDPPRDKTRHEERMRQLEALLAQYDADAAKAESADRPTLTQGEIASGVKVIP